MDFGKILKQWENRHFHSGGLGSKVKGTKKKPSDGGDSGSTAAIQRRWLEINGVIDKDKNTGGESRAGRRRRLRLMRPQDSIDLHLLTRDEAWRALNGFFISAKQRGLEKVLIIHGKGLHSERGEGVLRDMCAEFLEQCECAGECGRADKEMGGSGATWVILK